MTARSDDLQSQNPAQEQASSVMQPSIERFQHHFEFFEFGKENPSCAMVQWMSTWF